MGAAIDTLLVRSENVALFFYLPISSSVRLAASKAHVSEQHAHRLIRTWSSIGLIRRVPTIKYRYAYTDIGERLAICLKPVYNLIVNEVNVSD